MGDSWTFNGPVGAAGPGAVASQFTQSGEGAPVAVDAELLAAELVVIAQAMAEEASPTGKELGQPRELLLVQEASQAAAKGDSPRALRLLAGAGKWTLGAAGKVGTGLVLAYLKSQAGL